VVIASLALYHACQLAADYQWLNNLPPPRGEGSSSFYYNLSFLPGHPNMTYLSLLIIIIVFFFLSGISHGPCNNWHYLDHVKHVGDDDDNDDVIALPLCRATSISFHLWELSLKSVLFYILHFNWWAHRRRLGRWVGGGTGRRLGALVPNNFLLSTQFRILGDALPFCDLKLCQLRTTWYRIVIMLWTDLPTNGLST